MQSKSRIFNGIFVKAQTSDYAWRSKCNTQAMVLSNSKSGLILDNYLQKHRLRIFNNEHPTFMYSNNILDLAIATDIIVSQIDNFKTNDEIDSNHYAILWLKKKENIIHESRDPSTKTSVCMVSVFVKICLFLHIHSLLKDMIV